MNSNGFTKRNIFIGDVQITEDLTCGDMICQEMTLTGDINLDDKDIIGVNNLEVKTVNGGGILTNPLTSSFDADGNNIINNPEIDGLIQKTQYITAVEEFQETQFSAGILVNGLISNASEVVFANGSTITGTDADLVINSAGIGNISSTSNITTTADMTCTTINADAINVPAVTTLETKTQYQSVFTPSQATVFQGIVNATTTLAVGTAQSGQTGYNLPLSRPLIPGYVMVTPASTGNTLSFRSANLDGILNQSSILGISTTFANAVILGSPTYQMPTARGTNNQYIRTDGAGLCSFATFPTPTYGQIGRQLLETVGYSLTANVFRSATNLGGTMDTTFPNSANITPDSANGTLTYTELATKVLVVELDLRARIADAKAANGLLTLNLISGASTILAYDIARVYNTTSRTHLSCKIVQPVATGTVFSFSIGYDTNLTTDLFLSSISLSIYAAGF